VPVGNTGNSDYVQGVFSSGAVDYEYRIAKFEVTTSQYVQFLNAVAATDTYNLYDTDMVSNNGCNIERSGQPGSYTYSVISERANRPVNHVSWGDAARFVNWLHNGQPVGAQEADTTETGSYDLNGATSAVELQAVTRQPGATWAIPTGDEWHKAAYHKNDGDTGNYFYYPMGDDDWPSNDLVDPDPGNNATCYSNSYTIGGPYWHTEVGAHENSESPYGTFDQGGNVREWTEGLHYTGSKYNRIMRGGSYVDRPGRMEISEYDFNESDSQSAGVGFRLVQVPEPLSLTLLAMGGMTLLRRPRRRGTR
jgi:formylglycine-generating enzyme required for sulfatase activity